MILHLKPESEEFLDEYRLRNIITKYSDHIVLPIVMKKNEPEDKSVMKTEKEAIAEDKAETIVVSEEVVNRANALWTLSKSEINDEQYQRII